jgi:hypothetical protein
MLPVNLVSLIRKNNCKIDVNCDTKNTYNYKYWENNKEKNSLINDFDYHLKYTDGEDMTINLTDPDTYVSKELTMIGDNTGTKIVYHFSNKVYDLNKQIPMLKLFMAVYLTRNHAKYTINDNKTITFNFTLYNDDTLKYSSKIDVTIDNRILTGDDGQPIVVKSESFIDHMLLKAFVKLSNVMGVVISDINVNSLVGVVRGGGLFKLSLDPEVMVDVSSMKFNVEDVLNETCDTVEQKEERSTWISENVLKTIMGMEVIPYNNYAKCLYELFKNDMLIGITIGNSFFYIITDMIGTQYGSMIIKFYNIFTGGTIDLDFATVIYGMSRLGVVVNNNLK